MTDTPKKKLNIAMSACKSSQVTHHGYDPATKTLAVKFKSGGEYRYHGVPQEAYHGMLKAESVGKFIATSIKPHFKFKKAE